MSGRSFGRAATKAAVEAFTIGLAREVATEGIRVNAVAPGPIQTAIHAAGGDPDRPMRIAARIPMGRVDQPRRSRRRSSRRRPGT